MWSKYCGCVCVSVSKVTFLHSLYGLHYTAPLPRPDVFFVWLLSPGFLRFVRVLCGMSSDERKAFLQFTTGCSTLPPGGLANLHPRLTIVRKVNPPSSRPLQECLRAVFLMGCCSSGGCHRLELPVGQHLRPLPEASWIYLWGHHEGAAACCHHGERLPPQLTRRCTEHAPRARLWLTSARKLNKLIKEASACSMVRGRSHAETKDIVTFLLRRLHHPADRCV